MKHRVIIAFLHVILLSSSTTIVASADEKTAIGLAVPAAGIVGFGAVIAYPTAKEMAEGLIERIAVKISVPEEVVGQSQIEIPGGGDVVELGIPELSVPTQGEILAGIEATTGEEATTEEVVVSGIPELAAEVTVAAAVTVVLIVAIVVIMATMPLWLPKILEQSGAVNNTLYEAKTYIDFQGAVGSSCSRANLDVYPYTRKDLGTGWVVVGGDRGRACIPERYGANLYLVSRGVVVIVHSSIKDMHKRMKVISIGLPKDKSKNNNVQFSWSNG